MKQADIFFEAMKTRDHRFDGKFFVGVKTTGIYCRPICPAKPKRENVEFFKTRLEAEKAGYRPCLRCRPESAPQSPAWVGTSAVVQRAIKIMHSNASIELNENEFAAQFGVTARHLRRLFKEEIGKTPKQLSFEGRLNLARQLIIETHLPIAEIAFASGFSSIRRFNDAFRDRFKRSPTMIRRSPLSSEGSLKLSLAYRPPFNFDALMDHYRSHRVGDLERFENGKMYRIVEFDGTVGQIVIANRPESSQVTLEISYPDTSMVHAIVSKVRSLLDLDSDPLIIANVLDEDRHFKSLLKKHPGIRLPSGWDPFEIAIATILGQLVSVERGRALVSDLIELLGKESGLQINGKTIKLFPSPQSIASSPLDSLKTTSNRKKTLRNFSQAIVDGRISLEPTQDVDAFVRRLLEIPGIGPWTADYMALKCLRHTDAFPATDLILSRALEIHSMDAIKMMSPWRGYVAALLWRAYTVTLQKNKGGKK